MKRILAAAMVVLAANAAASGDYGPNYTMFKAYRSPDLPLERFQAGELGVLQPGMRRVYLYTAWRAMMLGPAVAKAPGTAQGLARADGSFFGYGWSAPEDQVPYEELVPLAAAALHLPARDPAASRILACPAATNAHAMRTWRTLLAREDATGERRDAWLRAQYQVGEACQFAEDSRYNFSNRKLPDIQPPQPLAESEPLFWRQLREYQLAAWQFHAEHYQDSTALFERIGSSAGHPMRGLGRYLALRSETRRLVAAAKGVPVGERDQQARALERRGAEILADKALAPMHEPTRALLRSMRASLTPELRFAELSDYLDNPASDPFALDRLGDWSILMDGVKPQDWRAGHDFIDWIETLRECDAQRDDAACAEPRRHALERWRGTGRRPWLVAALMLAEAMAPDMAQAARSIGPNDPAYLTARYHLARLYRLGGQHDEARRISDAVLQGKLSPGTRNLFREERFAVATSVQDAGNYLLRTNVDFLRFDPKVREDQINDDGLAWFGSLAVADMVELARLPTLPEPLRARMAGAAWIRAALLDKPEAGSQAAALLAQLVPGLQDAVKRYRGATSAVERRHVVLVASMAFGLSAELAPQTQPVERVPAREAVASAWCSFRANQGGPGRFVWRLPRSPEVGAAVADKHGEMARLAPLKTATGYVGDDVLQWAAGHPDDPELPWLLHAVVRSTRGGCLDPGASALSRKAYTLLHQRYPRSEWARMTPYFY